MVLSEPTVTVHELEEGDDFFIMACDGLWDVVSGADALAYAARYMPAAGGGGSGDGGGEDSGAAAACEALVSLALKLGSADNITVVVVDLRDRGTDGAFVARAAR